MHETRNRGRPPAQKVKEYDEEPEVAERERSDQTNQAGRSRNRTFPPRRVKRKVPSGTKMTGVISSINKQRCFGFVQDHQDGERFFHSTAVEGGEEAFKHLTPGDVVEYVALETLMGSRAVKVRKVDE